MQIGKPIKFCLAATVDSPAKTVFKWLPSTFALEPKIDGVRCQIHKKGEVVKLFTRNFRDISDNFPSVSNQLATIPQDFILDGELVAIDKNKILPFLDINPQLIKSRDSGTFICFDVLKIDDNPLAERPYLQRRDALEQLALLYNLTITPKIITNSAMRLKEFYINLIQKNYEGIVIKDIYAPYDFCRSYSWRKLKPVRTMDLKVTAELSSNLFNRYIVSAKEGEVSKIYSKKILTVGSIVEVKYDNIWESEKYSSGYTLRIPTYLRTRKDKEVPDSICERVV